MTAPSWRVAVLLTLGSAMTAQRISAQTFEPSLQDLSSSSSATRMAALDTLERLSRRDQFPLCSADASVQIRKGLIAGLETENEVVRTAASLSEEEADEYYGNLIGCVAGLRDTSAVQALIGAIDTGGGAIDGLVALGDAAVPALLRAAVAKSRREPIAPLIALGMLGKTQVSPANKAAIRMRELAALGDEDPSIKMTAIGALAAFPDSVVRGAIRVIALAPAQGMPGSETHAQTIQNMVRDLAIKWMKQDSASAAGALAYERPPSRFQVNGCTLECCGYRTWRATATRAAFATPDSDSRHVFNVRPNDKGVADSGVVVTLSPRLLRATRTSRLRVLSYPYRLEWESIMVPAGDTLYVLFESAEATDQVTWYRGALYWTSEPFADFSVLSSLRSKWWAAVKNDRGQIGWIPDPELAFTGLGECH